MGTQINNIIVILVTIKVLIILFKKKIRLSSIWSATVTPLASIIGSGFLISAPLLVITVGYWAIPVIILIAAIGYGIGSSIRYNIENVEPILGSSKKTSIITTLEWVSRPALGLAYIISVTFYLKLLAAFALRGTGVVDIQSEKMLVTVILLFIGFLGCFRGLNVLEKLEIYSVNAKLAIIAALLIGHFVYNIELIYVGEWFVVPHGHESLLISSRKILGLLIIIQGFETSRYLGNKYDSKMRIKTMRYAQIISGLIYVSFVTLSMPVFNDLHSVSETSVIDLCQLIAPVLPLLLIVAVILSQFSASVADIVGSGGMISESTKYKLSTNNSYLIIAIIAIVLTWSTNIYQIVSLASKGFAVYYAIQLMLSIIVINRKGYKDNRKICLFSLLFLLMILIIIFSIPVE